MEAVITFYYPPWQSNLEPNQGNVRHWLDNLYTRFQSLEQCRWQQSNIDTLFYAGAQSFVNRHFNFAPTTSYQQYYFNLIQQPVNMITGYQRQHRKSANFIPIEGADPSTTDQYSRLITNVSNKGSIHEQFSKSCELSAVAGMNLLQPYLDFTNEDQAQGELKVKIWEYNSFLVDPYFRNPDMSDAQFVWCQEYISKQEAEQRFPDKMNMVTPLAGSPQRYGNFYFLPENYNMARNDLMVLSYVWYKWRKKKKRLYSRSRNQFFDFAGGDSQLEQILYAINDMEPVTVDVPCWKVAVVLNDQLMFQGDNPLGDYGCPFTPVFWNYEPHINVPDLRVRSLVRTMRDPQFLFNYKVITNNDITAATINAGWKRKSGAVANEDNLKKSGQGWDVVINEGYEMTDVEKIIPSGVPESDMALAQQMADLIYNTSGINLENWSGQQDKQISTLTALIKQAANLMVFQKYFDQWDYSFKQVNDKCLQILLNNWNAEKVKLYIGEDPSPHFYSKVFAKYQVMVEESDITPTQQNLQAQQMFEINERFQKEVFPPSMIIPKLNISGKGEVMKFLQQQEQQAQQTQQEQMVLQHSIEDMKMKELMAKIHNQLSQARERDARAESNWGLLEERVSEVSKNHALATKEKMAALAQLLETIQKYGEIETFLQSNNLESIKLDEEETEERARKELEQAESSKKFMQQILGSMQSQQQPMASQNQG